MDGKLFTLRCIRRKTFDVLFRVNDRFNALFFDFSLPWDSLLSRLPPGTVYDFVFDLFDPHFQQKFVLKLQHIVFSLLFVGGRGGG